MDSTTNEIRPLTAMPSNQVAILSENSTPTIAALASATIDTAQSNSPSEHIEITNIHNYNAVDCLQRLSDGDVSDGITRVMIIAITMGVVCLCAIGYQFIRQLPFILKHTPAEYRARTLILSSVYVIIGLATFVSLIAYQAFVFCDSVCHFTFVVCAYQYFALIIDYVDGESNFIIKTHGQMIFDMQTPPICCCLRFLKPLGITKKKFQALRLMVLQMSIIQGTLLAMLNVFNAIDTQFYEQSQPIVSIFIGLSIMTGVWSLQITSRMIDKHLPDHKIMFKYVAIQLVLVLCKLQPLILSGLSTAIGMTTNYRVAGKCVENAIIQLIILIETVFLAYFANQSYSVPTKVF